MCFTSPNRRSKVFLLCTVGYYHKQSGWLFLLLLNDRPMEWPSNLRSIICPSLFLLSSVSAHVLRPNWMMPSVLDHTLTLCCPWAASCLHITYRPSNLEVPKGSFEGYEILILSHCDKNKVECLMEFVEAGKEPPEPLPCPSLMLKQAIQDSWEKVYPKWMRNKEVKVEQIQRQVKSWYRIWTWLQLSTAHLTDFI